MEKNNTPIDDYIRAQSVELQPILLSIRDAIRVLLPEAEERISWKMPTFWQRSNIVHFAAHKKHVSLYPGPAAIEQFAKDLESFSKSKGAIKFPYDRPLPLGLIAEISQWCLNTGNHA